MKESEKSEHSRADMTTSGSNENVIAYPYRRMIENTVGLAELLEAREALLRIQAELAFVDAVTKDLKHITHAAADVASRATLSMIEQYRT